MLSASHSERVTVGRYEPVSGVRWSEHVRGRVRVYEPAGLLHASVASALFLALATFVRARSLGVVFAGNTGFELPGLEETVRAPDVAYVSSERIPIGGFDEGHGRFAPDLAVEILSSRQSAWEMNEKLEEYLAAGVREVWVVDPRAATVAVHARHASTRWLREHDVLTGDAVLPGFAMPVAELFRVAAGGSRET